MTSARCNSCDTGERKPRLPKGEVTAAWRYIARACGDGAWAGDRGTGCATTDAIGGPMCTARRVLIVDDAASLRALLHTALAGEEYTILVAHHGAAGLALAIQSRPCVILLDHRMPVMDGSEFVRAYRQTPPPHARIVLMTAEADGDRLAATLAVDAHLKKPFHLGRLFDLVEEHVLAHAAA